jgi:hypothetical protein
VRIFDERTVFVALAHDDERPEVTPADQQRLSDAIGEQGFKSGPLEFGIGLEVWRPEEGHNFLADACLGSDWMVQISIDTWRLDYDTFEENSPCLDALVTLIGIVTEVAGSYLGFVTLDTDDDLEFMVEDPPVRLTHPLAVTYLGRRYLRDWPDEPTFTPEARWDLPAGILLMPSRDLFG